MARSLGSGKGIVERVVKRKVRGRVVEERRLYVRLRFKGPDGQKQERWRRVVNRTEAAEVRREMV